MLAKLTSKNQLTLPKAVVREFPGTRWRKIESLGITEKDVEDAVASVRGRARHARCEVWV